MKEVDGIVAVPLALKEGIEQNGIETAVADVRDLLLDARKAMAHLAKIVFTYGAAIAERLNLIKDTFVKPHSQQFSCRSDFVPHKAALFLLYH